MIEFNNPLRKLLKGTFFLLALWGAGFLYFLYSLPEQPSDAIEPTDAIVVWTGGDCRIATGLNLLSHGASNLLFISGVYREFEIASERSKALSANDANNPAGRSALTISSGIINRNPVHAFKRSCDRCRINLTRQQITHLLKKTHFGTRAKTTIGNAIETAHWVRLNRIHSIRLVTSPMHIPRSLIECLRYLPDIHVIIHPIALDNFNHHHWYKDWRIAYKVALEYTKYVSVLLGFRIQRQENLYDEEHEILF